MTDTIISFEVAKLAKEKGFDVTVQHFYGKDQNELYDAWGSNKELKNWCTAPTQSLLQKWLREKHDIVIKCDSMTRDFNNGGYKDWYCDIRTISHHIAGEARDGFETYEEALEQGLLEALELLS